MNTNNVDEKIKNISHSDELLTDFINKRIQECSAEHANYSVWLSKLRLPNIFLVGLGSLLAFLGGTAILTQFLGPIAAGIMALLGGALTGLHSWLGCGPHQLECQKLLGKFESLKSRYEYIKVEPDQQRQLQRL